MVTDSRSNTWPHGDKERIHLRIRALFLTGSYGLGINMLVTGMERRTGDFPEEVLWSKRRLGLPQGLTLKDINITKSQKYI